MAFVSGAAADLDHSVTAGVVVGVAAGEYGADADAADERWGCVGSEYGCTGAGVGVGPGVDVAGPGAGDAGDT